MTSEFDKLQEEIMADMRRVYTKTVIDHAMHPRNAGSMENADAFTSITGPCGDTMVMWLKVIHKNLNLLSGHTVRSGQKEKRHLKS